MVMVEPVSCSRDALPSRGNGCELAHFARAVPNVTRFSMLDHSDQQAACGLDGHADVHWSAAMNDAGFVVVRRVHLRELTQHADECAHEERQQSELRLIFARVRVQSERAVLRVR